MNDQEKYKKAEEIVEAKLGFFRHFIVYLAVNAFLLIINLITSSHHLWFQWPLIGWGIGLFFHGVGVFSHLRTSSLKERMIEKEMKKQS
jgi:hypothetical protein